MCDPVTISAAVAVASAGLQARQSRAQGKFQRGTADFNARTAQNEAEATRTAATATENTQRQRTAELLSKQRAQLGASGVALGSGSALQLQQDTITLGEADALRIRERGDQSFQALQTESELTEAQGGFAEQAGRGKAVGSLLTGIGNVADTGVADKWFTPKSAGRQLQPGLG